MHSGICYFGNVAFDQADGRLTVAGRVVDLDRNCLAILSLLLAERGNSVSKERLLEAGWPNRIVHENSLAKAIGRLRRALGHDGDALKAVYGEGYRLGVELRSRPAVVAEPKPARSRRVAARLSAAIAGMATMALTSSLAPAAVEERPLLIGEAPDAAGRLLWVDDHPENNRAEVRFFEDRKVAVYKTTTTEDALALLSMYNYDAVISDMGRADRPLAGIDLVEELRARGNRTPVYFYTILPSEAQRKLIADAGAQGALVKSDDLYATLLPIVGRRTGILRAER